MSQVNRRTALGGAAAGLLAALLTQGTSWAAAEHLTPLEHPQLIAAWPRGEIPRSRAL